MKIAKCYRCQQNIWFGETELGKTIPVNTWTNANGKIVAIDPEADEPMVHFLKKGEPDPDPSTKRYVSHLGTCKPPKK
jgi:hypothetical protein